MRPSPVTRARPRLRRVVLVALVAGTTLGVACSRDQRAAAGRGCLICGMIGWSAYKVERDDLRAGASCGACPSGQGCNTLYAPPRCAPSPGTRGVRCGTAHTILRCADGYDCVGGACEPKPSLGDACQYGFRGSETASGGGYCAPGLACGPDDRCRRGCPAPCPLFEECSVFEDPPRCVPSVALSGRRCGRLNRMRSIDCLAFHVCVDRGAGGVRERAGAEGAPCGRERCPQGFACDGDAGVCRAR